MKCVRIIIGLIAAIAFSVSCSHEPLHEHTYSNKWSADENHHWHAATCEHTEETSDRAEHSWNSGVITINPTCDSLGVMTFTCDVCGFTQTESLPSLGHTLNFVPAIEASCEESGVIAHYDCKSCGKLFEDASGFKELVEILIPALGHDFGEWTEYASASCYYQMDGIEIRNCTRCGILEQRTVPYKHNLTVTRKKDATCEAGGILFDFWYCKDCCWYFLDEECTGNRLPFSYISNAFSPPLGHIYTSSEIIKQPTCTEEGLKRLVCSHGHTDEVEIAALGHNNVTRYNQTSASCTSDGKKFTYWYCPECKKYFSDSKCTTEIEKESWVIPSMGHNWGEWQLYKAATCTGEEQERRVCSRCNRVEYKTTAPALGHNMSDLIPEVPATCVDVGTKAHYHCDTCGKTFSDAYGKEELKDFSISPTGLHVLDEGCSNGKYETIHECTVCHATVIMPKYSIGSIGPAGGYIFYDCDADNESGNADGLMSSTCGWRYLEAAPSDLCIIPDDSPSSQVGSIHGTLTVDSTVEGYKSTFFSWGHLRNGAGSNALGNWNLWVNGKDYHSGYEADCTKEEIGAGKRNTMLLVSAMGYFSTYYYSQYKYDTQASYKNEARYAARMCDMLSSTFEGKTYGDWYLPSKDELNLMYVNLASNEIGSFKLDKYYWSSSEIDPVYAWYQSFYSGDQYQLFRSNGALVRPIRYF